jgi:hypothetical protein
MRRLLACASLLLVACGGPAPADVRPKRCDTTVLGACVVSAGVDYDPEHIERALRLALAYWNVPEDTLSGWAIVFSPGEVTCNGGPGTGCTYWDANRTAVVQVLDPRCPETAQLVHELGHVLHHDPGHTGPWWSWTDEQDATWGIVRSPGATTGCTASRYYVQRP